MGAADVCGGCSLRRGSAASASTSGEIVATADWDAIISPAETARDPRAARQPGPAHEQDRPPLPAGGLLGCSHCGERLVARPRSGGQRRYACAKGPGFSGCGKTYINADDVERFVTEAVLHRLDSPELAAAIERRQAERRTRSAGWQETEAAQAQLAELAAAYGQPQITMRRTARRSQADRAAADHARKQLGKLTRTSVLDRYVGNADELRADWDALDLSQQHAIVAAVLDHVVVGPARRGYNRFDESRLTPVWRRLSQQLRDLRERRAGRRA